MYVKDCCQVLAELIFNDLIGAINISTGIPIKLSDIGEKVAAILEKEQLLTIQSPEKVTQRIVFGNNAKLEKELKFKLAQNLEKGLKETIQWRAENLKQVISI